jgi:hypothetical protein
MWASIEVEPPFLFLSEEKKKKKKTHEKIRRTDKRNILSTTS